MCAVCSCIPGGVCHEQVNLLASRPVPGGLSWEAGPELRWVNSAARNVACNRTVPPRLALCLALCCACRGDAPEAVAGQAETAGQQSRPLQGKQGQGQDRTRAADGCLSCPATPCADSVQGVSGGVA